MSGEDQSLVFDASISYRLPKRLGLITVGAKNLFDKSFRYQDSDPLNPMMQPRRLVYGKFTLAF
jgi:outer membrane receptor protein involved in Fe transport